MAVQKESSTLYEIRLPVQDGRHAPRKIREE
jgi:uncharacterized cupin superfamily protein